MAPDPPGLNNLDLPQLQRGPSHFARHGFAGLDNNVQPKKEEDTSGRAESLFGDGVDVPGPDVPLSRDHVKREDNEPGNFSLSGADMSGYHNTATKDDSDDDLMIVDQDCIPAHIRAKFIANPWRAPTPELEIIGSRVKQEPQSPLPTIELDGENPEPEVKDEPQNDSDAASLFGDDLTGDGVPDGTPKPLGQAGAVAAPRHQATEDDEAMFVDEVLAQNPPEASPTTDENRVPPPAPSPGLAVASAPFAAAQSHPVERNSASEDVANGNVDSGDQNVDEDRGHADMDSDTEMNVNPEVGIEDGADGGNGNDDVDHVMEDDYHVEEDDGGDRSFVIGDDQELSDGEQPRTRRKRPNQKKKPTGARRRSPTLEPEQRMNAVNELDKEDLEEELKIYEDELALYNRRKEKGKLGAHDKDRLDGITQKIEILKNKIREAPTAQELVSEGLRKMLEADDSGDENGQGRRSRHKRPAARIPAIARNSGSLETSTRKRKPNASPPSAKSMAKKQRRPRTTKANMNKTTQMLLEMVTSNDPIAARAQMDDLQVFSDFKANTLREQIQKLKEQIQADPASDQRRISADLKQLAVARKAFGRRFCKARDGQWLITGMSKLLHHYQLVGAGWMLRREVQQTPPYGGILADSVGLGKTIEAIACIMGNQMTDEERAEGKLGTLVVVPSNLAGQWQDEINACCPDITVVLYHSSGAHPVRMSNIRKADIVVTTYHEVAKAFPNRDRLKKSENLDDIQVDKKIDEVLGELFTVEWHRVILDEAHAIKNGHTHTSKACIALKSKFRWALTATPLHNGLYEVLPYMMFTGALADNAAERPNERKPRWPRVTGEQIAEFLDKAMMVRKIDNLFLGKALFEIPTTHPLPNIWISLSEEEFLIYRRVEEIIRGKINKATAMPGMAKKKATASFLQLAIRLRQAVSHPFTLFNVMRDTYDLNDIKDIRAKMREIKNANPDRRFIEQVGSWCETQLANGSIEGEVLQRDIPEQFGKGDHGYEFDMDPQLAKIEKSKSGKSGVCPICSEPHTAPRKTKCGHIFCRDCIENVIETERTEGSDTLNCPVCNKVHKLKEIMARQRTKRGALNVDMPGSDYSGLQPLGNEASAEFLEECDKNVHLAMAPSAKTVMVKDVILKWQEKVPDDKIIVFTQWVVVGRVIGRMLQQEKIGFVYYFGEMTQEEKEANVKAFHAVDEVKVMIASLKCGGQGLNLTCANRVILVDPWWNSALEHQAYGRVFRMGQKKETWFVRLLTRKTIDGRMARLQAKKLKEINAAIKDFDSTRVQLNFEEVAELFGRVRRDENGRMIEVESDYDTDDEEEAEDGAGSSQIEPFGDLDNVLGAGASGQADMGNQGGIAQPGDFTFGDSVFAGYGIQDLI